MKRKQALRCGEEFSNNFAARRESLHGAFTATSMSQRAAKPLLNSSLETSDELRF